MLQQRVKAVEVDSVIRIGNELSLAREYRGAGIISALSQ
jgi:hypothetical protein